MYHDFDKNIEEVDIELPYLFEKENNKSKDSKEKNEELLKESQNLNQNYRIDKQKILELQNTFSIPRLKVNLTPLEKLNRGKIGSISEKKFVIYDTATFTKLNEFDFSYPWLCTCFKTLKNPNQIKSVIELENNDLVFQIVIKKSEYYSNYELHIYRLKNKKYFLFQKILEEMKGYKMQMSRDGCILNPKEFILLRIKALSNNRILSISNYGIRIYSLNLSNNNFYSLILMDTHMEGINEIYEIDDKNLIVSSIKNIGASMIGPAYDYIMLEKIELIDIENASEEQRANTEDLFDDFQENVDKNNEIKKIKSSIKLISNSKIMLEYSTKGGWHDLSNFVVLKKKYFLIMIDHYLLIYNILTDEQMIRYSIVNFYQFENGIVLMIMNFMLFIFVVSLHYLN